MATPPPAGSARSSSPRTAAKGTLARAAELAAKACEGRYAAACALRGWVFVPGAGADEDRSAAPELFEKACDAGYAPGCSLLGGALEHGEGTPASRSGAWDAYDRACAGGYGPACAHTGGSPGAGLAPRPACKRDPAASGAPSPTPFAVLVERVRAHRPLAEGEVQDLPRWQARLLRNAVFASRGRSFEARDLRAFFSGYDWYAPATKDVDALPSPEDRRNVALLQEQEACAHATIADDAGPEDRGDWQLVELLLAEPDRPLSKLGRSIVGTWQPCAGPPAEGWGTTTFFANGRVVDHSRDGSEGHVGAWRTEGQTVRVRWFARLRLVGTIFNPAEPDELDDREPSQGVPKLFAEDGAYQDFGDGLFRPEVDDDSAREPWKLCRGSDARQ